MPCGSGVTRRATKGKEGLVRKKCEAWFMVIFGVTMCIVGTTLNVMNLIQKDCGTPNNELHGD